eukprot:7825535-Pyramimonas_sp.AAC.1
MVPPRRPQGAKGGHVAAKQYQRRHNVAGRHRSAFLLKGGPIPAQPSPRKREWVRRPPSPSC